MTHKAVRLKGRRGLKEFHGKKVQARLMRVIGRKRKLAQEPVVNSADPLSDPYDWGPEGMPEGKPFYYVPGKGFVFEV